MTKRAGYFKLARVGGTEVLVHWSLPAGGVFVSLLLHADPHQWAYFCVAYLLLIIVHEAGHVVAAVALRLKVFTVEITGFGGLCRVQRPRRIRDSVFVYTGGLLAQAVVFSVAVAWARIRPPDSAFANALLFTFTLVNAVIFVVNLIPTRSRRSGLATDGWVLWRLFLHVFRKHPHPHPPLITAPADQSPIFPPETRLLDKPGFRPPGFVRGIEILNDATTPMEFVVRALVTHVGLTEEQAIVKMLDIHNTGGMLIALPSEQEAQRIAAAVSADASAAGYSLVCRYAGTEVR